MKILRRSPDLLNQKLWAWGPAVLCSDKPSHGHSDTFRFAILWLKISVHFLLPSYYPVIYFKKFHLPFFAVGFLIFLGSRQGYTL